MWDWDAAPGMPSNLINHLERAGFSCSLEFLRHSSEQLRPHRGTRVNRYGVVVHLVENPRLKPEENSPARAARLESRAPPHECRGLPPPIWTSLTFSDRCGTVFVGGFARRHFWS